MDRDTKHFAIVAAIIGILLTLVMLYYANKSDKLVDDYANRTVQIDLTSEQEEKLKMQKVGRNCGQDVYEEISQCFLEASHD